MAVYQYVNEKREFAQVVVGGDSVDEVPPEDLTFFVARPEDEMEVYARSVLASRAAWSRPAR